MTEISYEIFDAESRISADAGIEIVSLLIDNYPDSHPDEEWQADYNKHSSLDNLDTMLDDGRVFIIARNTGGLALGFVEMFVDTEKSENQAMLAWMMVDSNNRNQGISSGLHQEFINQAREQTVGSEKPTSLILSVHPDNPAKDIYQHWGYAQFGGLSSTGKQFMGRALD